MKTYFKAIILILFLFLSCESLMAQHWDIFVKGGLTKHFDKPIFIKDFREHSNYTINFIEFGAGYFFNKYNEAGAAIGKNSFTLFGGKFIDGYVVYPPDTIFHYIQAYGLYEQIWYSVFYTFHFKKWNAGVKLGFIDEIRPGASDILNNFSVGRDISLNENTYLNVSLNYTFQSETILDFGKPKSKQVTIAFSLGFRL